MVTMKQIKKRIDMAMKRLARERDILRKLKEDAEALEASADNAIEDLERAADCLSELL